MIKRFLITTAVVLAGYLLLLHVRMEAPFVPTAPPDAAAPESQDPLHKVYRFSFSMYRPEGNKDLEIEGDSASIFTRKIDLNNVIAKAYAEETPVTITADRGMFDKSNGMVYLKRNVVATTNTGARLLTESLDINPQGHRMQTEERAAVRKDNIDVEGDGAESDPHIKEVTFKENVTVQIRNEEGAKQPTVITCDGPLEINYVTHVALFERNVIARDSQGTLTSDRMKVYYDEGTKRVSKMVATGNVVVISSDGNKTYSDNVVYLPQEGRVILGGDSETTYFPDLQGGGSSGDMDTLFGASSGGSSKT